MPAALIDKPQERNSRASSLAMGGQGRRSGRRGGRPRTRGRRMEGCGRQWKAAEGDGRRGRRWTPRRARPRGRVARQTAMHACKTFRGASTFHPSDRLCAGPPSLAVTFAAVVLQIARTCSWPHVRNVSNSTASTRYRETFRGTCYRKPTAHQVRGPPRSPIERQAARRRRLHRAAAADYIANSTAAHVPHALNALIRSGASFASASRRSCVALRLTARAHGTDEGAIGPHARGLRGVATGAHEEVVEHRGGLQAATTKADGAD